MQTQFYRVNNSTVPSHAMPRFCAGVQRPYGDGSRDLSGRPVGGRGRPWIVLRWDTISLEGFRWWLTWVGEGFLSVPISDLVVPDVYSATAISGYPAHSQWTRGWLERIQLDEEAQRHAMNMHSGDQWITGAITVRIVELDGRIA